MSEYIYEKYRDLPRRFRTYHVNPGIVVGLLAGEFEWDRSEFPSDAQIVGSVTIRDWLSGEECEDIGVQVYSGSFPEMPIDVGIFIWDELPLRRVESGSWRDRPPML